MTVQPPQDIIPVQSPQAVSPEMQTPKDEIDLGQVLRTLWRSKLWIMFCGMIALFSGGFYAFEMTTPIYTSTATIMQENNSQSSSFNIPDVMGFAGLGIQGGQNSAETAIEVLRSRVLLGKLVSELDLVTDPEFNGALRPKDGLSLGKIIGNVRELIQGPQPKAAPLSEESILNNVIDAMQAKLMISNVRQSMVFRIVVTTENGEKSARIANALAHLYSRDQLEAKLISFERTAKSLSLLVREMQDELEAAGRALVEFNSNSELISPEVLVLLNSQLKDLRDREQDARQQVKNAQTQLAALQVARDGGDLDKMAELVEDPTLSNLLEQVKTGSVTKAAFLARFNRSWNRAELQLRRSRSQAEIFATSILDMEQQVTTQSVDLVKLQKLEGDVEASRLVYEFFLGRLKENSVQQNLEQAASRLLSAAVVPPGASAPNKPIILALFLMMGLLGGSVVVLVRDLTQNTIRTSEELEPLTGHVVLGQIPLIPARRRSKVLKYITSKPNSLIVEAVRSLRTSTLFSNSGKPPQVIMTTSSTLNVGTTTLALALTHNLSGLGKKVLLIEGDIRCQAFSEYFDIGDSLGLAAVVSNKATLEETVRENKQLGASVLVGGQSETNAADIFSSENFTKLITEARSIYDFIVIDTPPILLVPDARVIGQLVDVILYAVRWDHTTKRQVTDGLKSLANVNAPLTGLVLTQVNPRGLKRYGYGDIAYGKSGRRFYEN